VLDETELAALLAYLKGRPLYMPAMLAAYTGLRRGEVLALRWKNIDFTKATLEVAQAVEVINGKLVVGEPKTERSRRTVSLPASLMPELTRHRKEQATWRLKLGMGKDSADLVFTTTLGAMIDPTAFSEASPRTLGRWVCRSRSTGCGIPTSRTYSAPVFRFTASRLEQAMRAHRSP
jgi:integrase